MFYVANHPPKLLELPADSEPCGQEHAFYFGMSNNLVLAYGESQQISWHCQSWFLIHCFEQDFFLSSPFFIRGERIAPLKLGQGHQS